MTEVSRIHDQLRRSYEGNAWHGPALRELLEDVSAEQAFRRPIVSAHTIAELVLHLAAWLQISANALKGIPMPQDPPQEINFPAAASQDENGWRSVQEKLAQAQAELEAGVKAFPESRLPDIVPGRKYSFYFLLHGVTQHTLYHAGQIALLKK